MTQGCYVTRGAIGPVAPLQWCHRGGFACRSLECRVARIQGSDAGEMDPAADAFGEEGLAVARLIPYHLVQLAEELERYDAE